LPELVLDDAEHRAFIFGLFGVLPEHAAEFGLEDVYIAQTTWDETMADSAARWLNASGEGARIAILAGNAHCHESAIPRRLTPHPAGGDQQRHRAAIRARRARLQRGGLRRPDRAGGHRQPLVNPQRCKRAGSGI
jgi:hypothetical protein